jgi:pSer/pThr/pTyr-binding forkhead associated (FHA) protein
VELPFDDDEVMPLQADDPRPQRVPQFPAGASRKSRRRSREMGRDRELAPRFDLQEYSDPGFAPAFVYVERGPGAGQLFPVKQGGLILGRSSSSDLRLQHPSISRRHAQLVRHGDRFTLRDLNSQNGTFVNRARITGEVELQIGDEIAVGNALLKLRGSGAPAELAALGVTVSPPRRRRGMSITRIAVIAAVAGSAVAALITLTMLKVVEEPAEAEAPMAVAVEPEPASDPAPPVEEAASAPEEPVQAAPAEPSAPAGESPTRPRTASASKGEPSAQAVALTGRSKAPAEAVPAKGTTRSRTRTSGIIVETPEEAAALARYEAGDVTAALTMARKARLESLVSRLTAFQAAESAGQKALAQRDTAGALKHLTTAFSLDQQLSQGWSTQGRELRKQLGNLHTVDGLAHLRAEDTRAARESFETALRFDPSNAQAKTHLARMAGGASK